MQAVIHFLFFRATQIKTYSWDNAQVILVGNKCDLEDDRLVPTEDGQRLAEELGITFWNFRYHAQLLLLSFCSLIYACWACSTGIHLPHLFRVNERKTWSGPFSGFQFFEASAKDNINVKQVFERLVDIICEKMSESMEGDMNLLSNHGNQGLRDPPSESHGGCAC